MKRVIQLMLGCLFTTLAPAQQVIQTIDPSNPFRSTQGLEPTVRNSVVGPIELVDLRVMPAIKFAALEAEDAARAIQGLPYRFAVPNEVFYTPSTSGTWEQLDGDSWLWRMRIIAPEAESINLGFTRYHMPANGTLFVYATDLSQSIRGFSAADNESHGELWTPPISGDDITIEVTLPADEKDQLDLELGFINHGYRGYVNNKSGAAALSGSCNVDVACPEGDPWRDQIAGVALIYIDGLYACTGFLVNNTALDHTPYLMTAEHCGLDVGTEASLIAFWNYENSFCRTPGSASSGQPGDGVLYQFNTGSIHRAEYIPTDMTLVELDDNPDPLFGVTFLGWNRSSNDPISAAFIHHPNAEEKRISIQNDPAQTTSYGDITVPGDGTHLRIDLDLGAFEQGSSGSPLFDQDQRVVGQGHGYIPGCENNAWYGRLSRSWTGGGTDGSRLSNWLDPIGTGATTLDFLSPLVDCNVNGIHDPEEIAADPSLDCQSNGILDSCELGSSVVENYDSVGSLFYKGWVVINNSSIVTTTTSSWNRGNSSVFPAQTGSADSYLVANFQSTDDDAGTETISNWMISPQVDLIDGKTFTFWTRTIAGSIYPDRLEVRLSTNGPSTDVGTTTTSVGDFTTVLTIINPTLSLGGYPEIWTRFNLVLSGLGAPMTGRFAFRYFVTDGGPLGANSNYIGIDSVEYRSGTNDTDGDGVPDECAADPCLADINNDDVVNVTDLLSLLAAWGDCPALCLIDLNGDGSVNVTDLLELLAAWGACP